MSIKVQYIVIMIMVFLWGKYFCRWEFLTEDYDIGFSLHHKSEVDEERTVLVSTLAI